MQAFRSFDTVLDKEKVEILKEEARNLFTAKKKARGGRYSAGDTYFITADQEARSIAEEYALTVFHWFTEGMEYNKSTSGAEYWPLVLDGSIDDVGAHYDKDYAAESDGEDLYPHVGTVTYLADYGAPTTFFEMEECVSRESTECSIGRGWISRVRCGKVVAFDGRYLHCAPSSLATIWGSSKSNGPRVTLLVNVWFHIPRDAIRCPFIQDSYTPIEFPNSLPISSKLPKIKIDDGECIEIEMTGGTSNIISYFDIYSIMKQPSTSTELMWSSGKCQILPKNKKKKDKKNQKNEKRGKKRR